MSWLWIALLACAVVVLIAAEWPRLAGRATSLRPRERERARRKANLRVLRGGERSESDEFVASVERDLSQLPTIEEDRKR